MRILKLVASGLLVLLLIDFASEVQSQPNKVRVLPKLEPVAETKLLMKGIAEPNFRGLGQMLTDKPKDVEAWQFARGRALLIGEMGNLLMMRSPKGRDSEEKWLNYALELRESASTLARAASSRDYAASRSALAATANTCNHCHRDFSSAIRVKPFPEDQK